MVENPFFTGVALILVVAVVATVGYFAVSPYERCMRADDYIPYHCANVTKDLTQNNRFG